MTTDTPTSETLNARAVPDPTSPSAAASPGERIHRALATLRAPRRERARRNRAIVELWQLLRGGERLLLGPVGAATPVPQFTTWSDVAGDLLLKILERHRQYRGQSPGQAFRWLQVLVRRHVADLARGRCAMEWSAAELAQERGRPAPPHPLTTHIPALPHDLDARRQLDRIRGLLAGDAVGLPAAAQRHARTYLEHVIDGVSVDDQARSLLQDRTPSLGERASAHALVFQHRRRGWLALSGWLEADSPRTDVSSARLARLPQ